MKNCPGCGASLQEGASFCEYCGAQVKTDPPVPSSSPKKSPKDEESGMRHLREGAPSGPRVALRTVSPVFMLLLSFLTFLFYPVLWVFLRRKAFDSMVPEKKLGLVLPLAFLAATVLFVAAGNIEKLPELAVTLTFEEKQALSGWSFLAWFASMTMVSFRMRTILRKFASRTDGSPLAANLVARSSAMTFFFQFLYIQHHMNLLVESGLADRE